MYIKMYVLYYTVFRNCTIPGGVKCRDNGTCIYFDMICNGISDCMDGSDEENCGKGKFTSMSINDRYICIIHVTYVCIAILYIHNYVCICVCSCILHTIGVGSKYWLGGLNCCAILPLV